MQPGTHPSHLPVRSITSRRVLPIRRTARGRGNPQAPRACFSVLLFEGKPEARLASREPPLLDPDPGPSG